MISKMLHCGLILGNAVGVTMRWARSAEPDSHAAVAVSASESSLPEQGIYLGLASGAKGVLIWSLFKRNKVKRTWQLWYDAYSECARELNGPRGLAQVFLFGERQSTLKVQQVQGSAAAKVTLGGSAEAGTTTEQERAQREVQFPSWTSAEFAYRGSRWLFLVNSANAPAAFTVKGCPPGSGGEDAFTGKSLGGGIERSRRLDLAAYEVVGLRFPLAGPAEQNK